MNQILHRVLSFDGGGIRGLYQAKLLECLAAQGLNVAQAADIVTGTSTGAIVAGALAIGIEADRITSFMPMSAPRSSRHVAKSAGPSKPSIQRSLGRPGIPPKCFATNWKKRSAKQLNWETAQRA